MHKVIWAFLIYKKILIFHTIIKTKKEPSVTRARSRLNKLEMPLTLLGLLDQNLSFAKIWELYESQILGILITNALGERPNLVYLLVNIKSFF